MPQRRQKWPKLHLKRTMLTQRGLNNKGNLKRERRRLPTRKPPKKRNRKSVIKKSRLLEPSIHRLSIRIRTSTSLKWSAWTRTCVRAPKPRTRRSSRCKACGPIRSYWSQRTRKWAFPNKNRSISPKSYPSSTIRKCMNKKSTWKSGSSSRRSLPAWRNEHPCLINYLGRQPQRAYDPLCFVSIQAYKFSNISDTQKKNFLVVCMLVCVLTCFTDYSNIPFHRLNKSQRMISFVKCIPKWRIISVNFRLFILFLLIFKLRS